MSRSRHSFLLCIVLGCEPGGAKEPGAIGADTGAGPGDTDDSDDSDDMDDTDDSGTPDAGNGCRSEPRDPDADRVVLANLPYEGTGADWAVLTLSADGTLTDTSASIAAGRTYVNPGVFTPDGSLGIAPLDDGTISIVEVDAGGSVRVVEAGFTTGFYAEAVAMHPSGERLYVVDRNWEENGGGLYVLDLDCSTGAPSVPDDLPVDELGRLVATRLPAAALPIPGRPDRLVLISGPTPADVRLIDTTSGAILDEVDVFPDNDAWLTTGAITPAGDLVLLTDTSAWSSRENALAAVQVTGDALTDVGSDTLYDGVGIGISPDGTTAIVSSGYGDDIVRLSLDATAADAVTVEGSLTASTDPPQLPGGIVTVQRGSLAGHSLVAEVYGIRSIQLGPSGEAMDLGLTGGRLVNPAGLLVQP